MWDGPGASIRKVRRRRRGWGRWAPGSLGARVPGIPRAGSPSLVGSCNALSRGAEGWTIRLHRGFLGRRKGWGGLRADLPWCRNPRIGTSARLALARGRRSLAPAARATSRSPSPAATLTAIAFLLSSFPSFSWLSPSCLEGGCSQGQGSRGTPSRTKCWKVEPQSRGVGCLAASVGSEGSVLRKKKKNPCQGKWSRLYWGGVECGGVWKRIRRDIKWNDIPFLSLPISEFYKKRRT